MPKVSRHQCDSRHHHTRKHEGSVASEAVDAFGEANVRLFYGTIFGENLGGGLLFKVLLISVRTTCFVFLQTIFAAFCSLLVVIAV